MIRIFFKCGHGSESADLAMSQPPVCPECGERQIADVKAPAPKFSGACSGPLVVKR